MYPAAKTTAAKEDFKKLESDNSDTFSRESVYIAMIGGTVVVAVILILILLVVLINMRRYRLMIINIEMIFIIFRKVGRTEFDRKRLEGRSIKADCNDSGHFSSDGGTRDLLLEQGGRQVCRSCGEAGREARGTIKERTKEEDYIRCETDEEYFMRKKSSLGRCDDK